MDAKSQVVLAIYGTWGAVLVAAYAKELAKGSSARKEFKVRTRGDVHLRHVPTHKLRRELERRDTDTAFLKIMHDNEIN